MRSMDEEWEADLNETMKNDGGPSIKGEDDDDDFVGGQEEERLLSLKQHVSLQQQQEEEDADGDRAATMDSPNVDEDAKFVSLVHPPPVISLIAESKWCSEALLSSDPGNYSMCRRLCRASLLICVSMCAYICVFMCARAHIVCRALCPRNVFILFPLFSLVVT